MVRSGKQRRKEAQRVCMPSPRKGDSKRTHASDVYLVRVTEGEKEVRQTGAVGDTRNGKGRASSVALGSTHTHLKNQAPTRHSSNRKTHSFITDITPLTLVMGEEREGGRDLNPRDFYGICAVAQHPPPTPLHSFDVSSCKQQEGEKKQKRKMKRE